LLTRRYGYALSFTENMTWAEIEDIAGRNQVQDIMSGVAKPRDWESFWMSTPDVFNMMYNPLANDIMGLAAFMQKPQYDAEMPMFYNFGFFGAVLGHELTHGFDSNGAERGPFGDKTNWWSASSRAKFEASKECFERQYSSYHFFGDAGAAQLDLMHFGQFEGEVGINMTEIHDNGTKCLGENIADSGGLGLAALAYQRWQERNGAEQGMTVAGQFFTAEQLFFLRYGASWCDLQSTEALQEQVNNLEEPHSVNRLRVVGAVQNSLAFSKAFKCKAGLSRMSPAQKCDLWGNAPDMSVPGHESAAFGHSAVSILIVLAILLQ